MIDLDTAYEKLKRSRATVEQMLARVSPFSSSEPIVPRYDTIMPESGIPLGTGPAPVTPVAGYTAQPQWKIDLENKRMEEEAALRAIEAVRGAPASHVDTAVDMRCWLTIASTHIEQGLMALNRAITQSQRIKLPGDAN
jgi:hypothetical protein